MEGWHKGDKGLKGREGGGVAEGGREGGPTDINPRINTKPSCIRQRGLSLPENKMNIFFRVFNFNLLA